MKLIIAEKPSVGIEIARALSLTKRGDGFIEGPEFIVTWAMGHLVELKEPDEYKAEWTWNRAFSWNELPMIPGRFELKVSKKGKAQFSIIASLMARRDVLSLVNACDAGREGELIFDYIYRAAGCIKPFERLWTSAALTQAAIKREMRNLRPGEAFQGLRMAARARAAADWLVGMNGTRAVTMSQRGNLYTVGRVQTPVLGFVVAREKEILAFVPEPFATVRARFRTPRGETFEARYEVTTPPPRAKAQTQAQTLAQAQAQTQAHTPVRTHQLKDEKLVNGILGALVGARFQIASVQESVRNERPPFLYDLTTLQRDANRLYGFSADKTLKLAQALYEKHKALTYPRTDSKHLPHEMRGELKGALDALAKAGLPRAFIELAAGRLQEKRERIFDDAKVSDHHALLPTAQAPRGMSEDETRIYRMVGKRLLAAFHDDLVTAITDVVVALDGTDHRFYAKGKTVLQPGWTEIMAPAQEDKDVLLPRVTHGETVSLVEHTLKEDVTRPPKRYTEADLLGLMENAGNTLSGESKAILKGRGIGTPATRASIIQGLLRREYVVAQGKTFAPSELGLRLIEVLRSDALKSPELTAQWERDLGRIETGEGSALEFSKNLKLFISDVVRSAQSTPPRAP